jgi:hypothetical protein
MYIPSAGKNLYTLTEEVGDDEAGEVEMSEVWLRVGSENTESKEVSEVWEMADAETYYVKIVGTKPLLMNAPTELSDKPTRKRGEHLDPKVEAEMRLYKDPQGNIVIPSVNIKACIREAGRNYRVRGRKSTFAAMIRAGIEIKPFPYVPLIHSGWTVDIRPVVVQRNRILRARPCFEKWSLEFQIINNDPTIIHSDTLHKILIDAGRYYGLGDFRPEFGTFKVEKFDIMK